MRRRWHWSDLIWVAALLYAAPVLLPHVGAVLGVRTAERPAPTWRYATLAGDTLSDAALTGQVVLVNFWATWCLPCRAEMPALEAMYQRHRAQGFTIVGLAMDQAPTSTVAAYVRARGVTYPVAHVGREAERRFGGVRGYPTSFLIGRDGRIKHVVQGPIGAVSLEVAVRRELAR
ncbi:MAG: TlpA family protein disulfide reductase [Gemmatimonadaceae bacterium]|nr:TlpA family protein disulfide reductase [Gemmatimonadaceae bacterium]